MRMGEFFSWEEMTYSRRAVEKGLDNRPGAEARKALEHLVLHLLDPLRRLYGKPIAVTSGYRCEEVNRLVGGVPDSQHVKGEAADCYVPDAGELLAVLRRSGLVFDQAIHYRKRNFLHLSLKRSGVNRMQVLVRLVVLCFLLSSCGMKRQSIRQERMVRMDTVNLNMQQEKRLDRHIQLADATAVRLQQVTYFAPDSLGRQYPQVVTNLQVDRVYQEADTSRCVQAEQQQYAESKREQNSEQKTVRARIRSPLWGLWGIVCLLLLCFLWRQKTD